MLSSANFLLGGASIIHIIPNFIAAIQFLMVSQNEKQKGSCTQEYHLDGGPRCD